MLQNIYLPERLVVYVVASDDGLAPNIQGEYCTLSVCKPVVRRVSRIGTDWVVGMSTNKHGKTKLVYVMQAEEKIPYDLFFHDERFQCKKPSLQNPCGDNFILNGRAVLSSAGHYNKPEKMKRNMNSPYAVCASRFWYFGENAPEIPQSLHNSKLVLGPRRGHKIVDTPEQVSLFYEWLTNNYELGIYGNYRDKKASQEAFYFFG